MSERLLIAGANRWGDLIKGTLQIETVLTYQADSATFKVRGSAPNEGDEVVIENEALNRLFAGMITKVAFAEASPARTEKIWQVECDDYTSLLDRRLVVEEYENMAADAIFRDIATKYCTGFTATGVRSGAPVVAKIVFDYRPPSECFKELCDHVGWQWQATHHKDLQFFLPEEINTPAPIVLEPGGNFRLSRHSIDQQGLRNRVYVRGGTMLSDPWSYDVRTDGLVRAWLLPHKPHDITAKVGGVVRSCGIENLHDESQFDFMMNYQEKYVRASTQTATPVSGMTMSFTYRYGIDVITLIEDTASQQAIAAVQGGDGAYEHVIADDSLITIDAAEAAGMADLRLHADPKVSGSFETEVPGWVPGQLVTINLPDRGIVGSFLVQKVVIARTASTIWTYQVEYGGRLLGISDWLQALWKAQQKKRLNETNLLQKFFHTQERLGATDTVGSVAKAAGAYVTGEVAAIVSLSAVDMDTAPLYSAALPGVAMGVPYQRNAAIYQHLHSTAIPGTAWQMPAAAN